MRIYLFVNVFILEYMKFMTGYTKGKEKEIKLQKFNLIHSAYGWVVSSIVMLLFKFKMDVCLRYGFIYKIQSMYVYIIYAKLGMYNI